MKRKTLLIFLMFLVLIVPGLVEAASPPRTIFYQGRLTNDTGVPLDGTFTFDFRIYDASTGGNKLWPPSGSENHTGVSVDRGVYSVYLGTNKALSEDVFDTKAWLEVDVDGNTFSPRTELSAMPYAFNAYRLDGSDSGFYRQDLSQVLSEGNSAGSNNIDLNGQKLLLNGGWLSGDGDTALTVTAAGDIGINESSPTGSVHIIGDDVTSSNATLKLEESGEGDQMFLDGDEINAGIGGGAGNESALYLQNTTTNDIYMATGGGSVGIDTTSPVAPLDIGNQGYIGFHNTQDYFLGGGKTPDARSTGIHLEANTNPADGSALFVVESSGGAERFAVEHRGEIRGDNNLAIDGFPSGSSFISDGNGVNLSDTIFLDGQTTASDTIFFGGTEFWRPYLAKDNEGDGAAWLELAAGGGVNVLVDRDANDGGGDHFEVHTGSTTGSPIFHGNVNGNAGVGTASPGAKLHVHGGNGVDNHGLIIDADGENSDSAFQVRTDASAAKPGTPQFDIDGTGNADFHGNNLEAIGTVTSGFTVQGTVEFRQQSSGGYTTRHFDTEGDNFSWNVDQAGANDLNLHFNGSTIGWFDDADGSWNTASDRRRKENIQSLDGVLPKIMKLKVRSFSFKRADSARESYGFIAQDVESVFPSLVTEKGGHKYLSYQDFTPLAIKALQEQQNTIRKMQKQIESLQEAVSSLKKQRGGRSSK